MPLLRIVLGAVLFALAYGQAPLYYSNQNQYYLHGLAHAGVGFLDEDWLANTADPTPIFSALVAVTARWLHPWAFHLYQAILLAGYAVALVVLFAALVGPERARRWPLFLALVVAVHAAGTRWLSYRLLGLDYPWYFQSGVAGQYVLGAMLQPSVFGVLLIVALALFAQDRPYLAVAAAVLGATVHSTYLLPAGLLTAGFMTALIVEGKPRRASVVGAAALVLVLPVTLYVLLQFQPTSPQAFQKAQDILVNVRIPHHCLPRLWLDPIAGLQIAWIVVGVALLWRTRLFPGLGVVVTLAAALTIVQVATGSNTLALLFPWRISAILVPVATAVVLARLVARLPGDRAFQAPAMLAMMLFAAAGLWINLTGRAFGSGDEELAMMDFVRRNRASHQVYLVPVRIPNLAATTRGSASSDFKPVAEKRQDNRLIPVDLQRFRLATGAPIFVDFKSIPYRDTDVIDWHERLVLVPRLQEQMRASRSVDQALELVPAEVTHIVQPADARSLEGKRAEKIYEDAWYAVYRLIR